MTQKNLRQLLFLLLFLPFSLFAQKKNSSFSGEMLFNVERVAPPDSSREMVLIYAKDSLLKVINFSTQWGQQELIKHISRQKSYLLISTTKGNYAIRTEYTKNVDTSMHYTYKKTFGHKRIGGFKAKKLKVQFSGINKDFDFYYYKKIPAKYGSAFTDFPGLVAEYFLPSDQGLFKYTLTSLKNMDPPLSLFMIPENYKKVSLEQFLEEIATP